MVDPNTENPANVKERPPEAPVVADVKKAFEEKATEVQGDKTVYETHREEFQKVVDQIPEDQRGSLTVRLGDMMNRAGGTVHEVYAKVWNFVYNTVNPLTWSSDVPKNYVYEMEKAKVRAAGQEKPVIMKQRVAEYEAFKKLIPFGGSTVAGVVDRIVGPAMP